jgi:glutamate-ammonia-ligase adenylyltransferase
VRKLITWLTLRTAAGELFDIDTALRPNGNSGLLVTSIAAFERYQVGRGSNTAWTWEHQALTRARFAPGCPRVAAALRGRAPRGAGRAARPPALRDEVRWHAREGARRRGRCRPGASTSSTAPAA